MATPITIYLLATPYVSASSLFGLFDALSAAGKAWEEFVTGEPTAPIFDVKIVGQSREPFYCGSGTLVVPDLAFEEAQETGLVVVPGMSLSATEPLGQVERNCYDWIDLRHQNGSRIVAACTGVVYLAETGLLDGQEATTHWAFSDLFRRFYSSVIINVDRSICFEDADRGIVTSGGATAWQELALFLITNYGSTRHAVNAAKWWLIPDHGERQAPYVSIIRRVPHNDAIVKEIQTWIADHYAIENPVKAMSAHSGLPARTFARRFRKATGFTPQDYVQILRVEEAKQLLETGDQSVPVIGQEVGYEDAPSFRLLFKRKTGLAPAEYRRMFGTNRFARYE